ARRRAAVRAPRRALGRVGRRERGPARAAHALPRRHARGARLDTRRPAGAHRRALPRARGAVNGLDPAAFADLLAGYCLDVQARDAVLVRSTALAAPLLLELQRAILEREAWPLLRVELAGQTRSFYDHARDVHLDDYPDLMLTEAKKIDAL